jgi:hypothetical protein
MTESAHHPIKHAGMTVAFAAAVLGILADLLASGLTVDVVNNAVDALSSLDPEDPKAYFTVGMVFMATAPLVLGAIGSVVIVVEQHRQSGSVGYGTLFGLIVLWWVVGQVSATFIPGALTRQAPAGGGTPPELLFRAVVWAAQPYGVVLAVQGIVLGLIAAGSYYVYQQRAKST